MSEHLPIVAMYMALGADRAMKAMSRKSYGHFVDDRSGHLGVMNDYVLEIAKHVAARLDARGHIENWPGVFDYEVSEPLGAEVIKITFDKGTLDEIKEAADAMIEEFFQK